MSYRVQFVSYLKEFLSICSDSVFTSSELFHCLFRSLGRRSSKTWRSSTLSRRWNRCLYEFVTSCVTWLRSRLTRSCSLGWNYGFHRSRILHWSSILVWRCSLFIKRKEEGYLFSRCRTICIWHNFNWFSILVINNLNDALKFLEGVLLLD